MEFSKQAQADVTARIFMEKAHTEAEQLYAAVQEYGPDYYFDGAILQFRKGYKQHGTTDVQFYTYVALKANGRWYRTGFAGSNTWDEFVMWLLTDGEAVHSVQVEPIPVPNSWCAPPEGWTIPKDRNVPAGDLTETL